MPEVTFLIVSFLTFVFTCVFLKWSKLVTIKRLPNGPIGLPFVGHLPLIGNYPPAKFMEWKKRYGNVFCIRFGSWNTVVVSGYKAVKVTAENMKSALIEKPKFLSNQIFMESISKSVGRLSYNSCDQRFDTEMSLCLFTTNRSEHIEKLAAHEASLFVDDLLRNHKIMPDYIQTRVQTFAAKLIYQLLYGHEEQIERQLKVIIDTSHSTDVYNRCLIDFIPWLSHIMPDKVDLLRQFASKVHTMISEQLRNHCETFNKDNIRDITDALLATVKDDANNRTTPHTTGQQRLEQTLMDLQRIGFDILDKTLSWLILYMAKYPDIQEHVHKEIDDLIGRRRRIELKDKPGLVYTNAVILEVMRITSVMPFSLPYRTTKDTKIEGFDVEKGTLILFNLYSIHHDKNFWDNPEIFRPERFVIEDHILDVHKCSHIVPFGLGRRRCVGELLAKMNVFIAFATIMQRCRFVCPSDTNLDLEPIFGHVSSPKNYKVFVEDRF